MKRNTGLVAAALLATLAGSANAHHSRAMFDLTRHIELTGAVREFQWTNPHCYIQLTVTTAQGRTQDWTIEMGPPHSLKENGWGKTSLRPGDRVRITINPLRSGGNAGELEDIARLDGAPIGKRV
jgi:hypothetical protein